MKNIFTGGSKMEIVARSRIEMMILAERKLRLRFFEEAQKPLIEELGGMVMDFDEESQLVCLKMPTNREGRFNYTKRPLHDLDSFLAEHIEKYGPPRRQQEAWERFVALGAFVCLYDAMFDDEKCKAWFNGSLLCISSKIGKGRTYLIESELSNEGVDEVVGFLRWRHPAMEAMLETI